MTSYAFLFRKHIWDFCYNGTLLTYDASRIVNSLENVDLRNLGDNEKHLVKKFHFLNDILVKQPGNKKFWGLDSIILR